MPTAEARSSHLLRAVAEKGAPGRGSAAVHQGLAGHEGVPRGCLLVARQDRQGGRLARTIRPQKAKALPGWNAQAQIMHRNLQWAAKLVGPGCCRVSLGLRPYGT